jgi:hypothetical protein
LISQTALTILEIAVACIQGYVFIVLVALYSKESYVINTPLTLFSSGRAKALTPYGITRGRINH